MFEEYSSFFSSEYNKNYMNYISRRIKKKNSWYDFNDSAYIGYLIKKKKKLA